MAFWHPFADMAAVSQQQLVIERGEGVWVYDTHGTRYFDATASLWYANIGHGRAEVADAVAAQLRTLEAYHTFGDMGNRPAAEVWPRHPARGRAVRQARGACPDARGEALFDQRRRRLDRGRGQARAPPLHAARPA